MEEARSHPKTRRGGTWRARERSSECTLTTKGSYGPEHHVGDIFYQCPCLLCEQTHSGSPGSRDNGEVGGRLLQWSEGQRRRRDCWPWGWESAQAWKMFRRRQGSPVDWKQEEREEEEIKDHESLWREPRHRCGATYRNGRAEGPVQSGEGQRFCFSHSKFSMPVRP